MLLGLKEFGRKSGALGGRGKYAREAGFEQQHAHVLVDHVGATCRAVRIGREHPPDEVSSAIARFYLNLDLALQTPLLSQLLALISKLLSRA